MASTGREHRLQEVHLSSEAIEALANLIAKLVRHDRQPAQPRGMMSAAEVAEWFGVERSWVYAHAEDLGACRLGFGDRPRLRFDPGEVGARIEALGRSEPRLGRGSGPIAGDVRGDSLPRRHRAIVARQVRAAGRCANAPARRRRTELGAMISLEASRPLSPLGTRACPCSDAPDRR